MGGHPIRLAPITLASSTLIDSHLRPRYGKHLWHRGRCRQGGRYLVTLDRLLLLRGQATFGFFRNAFAEGRSRDSLSYDEADVPKLLRFPLQDLLTSAGNPEPV